MEACEQAAQQEYEKDTSRGGKRSSISGGFLPQAAKCEIGWLLSVNFVFLLSCV